MALKKDYIDENSGLTITDAYFRIVRIDDKREDNSAFITLNIYKSQEDREVGKAPLPGFGVKSYTLNGNNYQGFLGVSVLEQTSINHVQQCYEYLKTLPVFESAVDC